MKILSVDTASNICGVSILEDTDLICKLDTNTGTTHSENLMPMIEKAFQKTNLSLKDIDLLVCDKGPGSFTGIRIGVATIKAFHDSLNIPYIGITSLESLAYNIKTQGLICSILDCKNDNCYFALYEKENNSYNILLQPSTQTIQNTLEQLSEFATKNRDIVFVGDGNITYKNQILNSFPNAIFAKETENELNSYNLGLAGLNYFNNKIYEDVLPLYLKKPQAQKQLEEKLNSKENL